MKFQAEDKVIDFKGRKGTVVFIGAISQLPHILWENEQEPKIWPYITLQPIKIKEG